MSTESQPFRIEVRQFEKEQQENISSEPLLLEVTGRETVAGLKDILKERLSGHPASNSQTLIFRGKILRNEQSMVEVFKNTESRSLFLFFRPPGSIVNAPLDSTSNTVKPITNTEPNETGEQNEASPNTTSNYTPSPRQEVWSSSSGTQAFPLIGFMTENGEVLFINELALQYREMLGVPLTRCRIFGQQTVSEHGATGHNGATAPERESSIFQIISEIWSRVPFRVVLFIFKTLLVYYFIARKLDLMKRIALGIFMTFLFLYQTGVVVIPNVYTLQNALRNMNETNTNQFTKRVAGVFVEFANLILPFFMSLFPAAMNEANLNQ